MVKGELKDSFPKGGIHRADICSSLMSHIDYLFLIHDGNLQKSQKTFKQMLDNWGRVSDILSQVSFGKTKPYVQGVRIDGNSIR